MLTNQLPAKNTDLVVLPRPIELVFSENGLSSLTLILPPLEDMADMDALGKVHFSLKEFAANQWERFADKFAGELDALENKSARFQNSPTFLNRLANLAELAGDRDREEGFLRRLRDVVVDDFVEHRLGDNLIARGMHRDAEEFYSQLNLREDAFANLRLAFFHVQRRDLEAALPFVRQAVSIDPLDFSVRLFEGSLQLVRGQYELAIQSFRFAAEERQTSSPLFTNLALAYIYVGKPDKAFSSLRKAVALDPTNANAIALLADLAYSKNKNEEAIPSLRYFLLYEQKNPTMWARLARALLGLGKTNEAIAALKRQGSLENTCAVWNNLGVAYQRSGEKVKALRAYKHAMKLESDAPTRNFFLAARNLTSLLLDERSYKDVLSFSNAIIFDDDQRILLSDPQLADIYIFHLFALAHTGARKQAAQISEQLLSSDHRLAPKLTAWLASTLIAHYSIEGDSSSNALKVANRFESLLTTLGPSDSKLRDMLANNIAFAYLEAGQIDAAGRYLKQLTHGFHKEPYSTATLGLFHMRKGNFDRADRLYEEAIVLAGTVDDKTRIRQKLNLELGLRYLDSDQSRSRRYLQKVAEHAKTLPQFAARAQSLLSRLSRPGDKH